MQCFEFRGCFHFLKILIVLYLVNFRFLVICSCFIGISVGVKSAIFCNIDKQTGYVVNFMYKV